MQFNPTLHKLSNGVTVILDPMDLETVSAKVLFCTGARDEAPHEYGITHFFEHMLFTGTQRFASNKDMIEHLAYNGGTYNGVTSNSRLALYGRILAENTNVLFDVFADMLQNTTFDEKKIEIERGVILDEYRRDVDGFQSQFMHFISRKLFNYAAPSRRTLGNEETIKSFTRDQLLDFKARRISAKNCIICVSGRIDDADGLLAYLDKKFAFLPTHDVPENKEIHYTPDVAHRHIPNIKNVYVRILFPELWSPRYDLRYNAVAATKFERYMVENIKEVVRRQNGLVYGFSDACEGTDECWLTGFSTETSPENIARVVELVAQNAAQIYNDCKITDHDLERYWRKNRLADADFKENATRRCDKLINYYRQNGRIYDMQDMVDIGRRITPADVIKYSRGYFDGDMSIVSMGGDFKADLRAIWNENFKIDNSFQKACVNVKKAALDTDVNLQKSVLNENFRTEK